MTAASGNGPKPTCESRGSMSAVAGGADITMGAGASRSRIHRLLYPNEKVKALSPAFGIVRRNTCSPGMPL